MNIIKNKIVQTFSFVLLLILSAVIQAGEFQSIQSIRAAAKQHVLSHSQLMPYQTLEVSSINIDNRLKLAQCSHALQAFSPAHQRRGQQTTVGISCQLPKSWKIYIPVKVTLKTPVIVASHTLNPGEVITQDDLRSEIQSVNHLSYGYYDQAHKLINKRVKSQINAGSVLTPAMLQAAIVIKRGQTITMTAKLRGLNIQAQGKALTDGVEGESIRIKNLSSGNIIEGTVQSNGTVVIHI